MRRSKDLIEDHLGTAVRALRVSVGRRFGRRRPRGAAPVPHGGARCVEDEPSRADRPLPARPRADPAERRPVLLPPQGAWAARHRGLALPRARARTVGEGVSASSDRARHHRRPEPAVPPAAAARRVARRRVRRHDDQRAGSVGRRHRGRGHPPHPVAHATRAWDPRADVRAFRELVAIFRRERFDLVHTHNPKPGVMGRVAARVAGVPRVMNTVHGLYATPEDRLRRRAPVLAAEWIAARCSDLELYQSAEDLAWARRLHLVRPGRSLHLGNGIDLTRFTPGLAATSGVREAPSGARDRRGRAGRRDGRPDGPREGLRGALRGGAGSALRACPNARFLAVGDSDPDEADAVTADRIERAGDDFVFTGWREDIADLMALDGRVRAAVVARGAAALGDRGRGERAAAGAHRHPRVSRGGRATASRASWCRCAIRRVWPTRSCGSLQDPTLRRRMGDAARARAEERFDERRVAATVVGVTRSLVGRPGACRSRTHGRRGSVARG